MTVSAASIRSVLFAFTSWFSAPTRTSQPNSEGSGNGADGFAHHRPELDDFDAPLKPALARQCDRLHLIRDTLCAPRTSIEFVQHLAL